MATEIEYEARDVPVPGPRAETVEESDPADAVVEAPAADSVTPKLLETIDALNQKVTSTQQNGLLLSDPDVRALLAAKQSGKKFKIVEDGVEPERVADNSPPPDLESMTNAQLAAYQTKQTLEALSGLITKSNQALERKLEERFAPAVTAALAHAQSDTQRRIAADIASVQARYKDFDLLRPKMEEINRTVQGASVEELYHLAKLRSGLPAVTQKEIETERPTAVAGQRKKIVVPANTLGRKGFQNLLAAALVNVGSNPEE